MKRILVLLLFTISAAVGVAQTGTVKTETLISKYAFANERLYIPDKDTTWTPSRNGALTQRPADGMIYQYFNVATGPDWTPIIGGGGGGGSVSSVFGRMGAVVALEADYSAFYPVLSGTYNNPTWLNELAWSKITGTPTTLAGYGITDPVGTVTSVSDLSPLFTTANPTTTPTFSLSNAGAYTVFGNQTSGSTTPTYSKLNVNTIDATGSPSSGNFLRGDGQWIAGALSPWSYTGSDIYYNGGKVGIGTSTPSTTFTVHDSLSNSLNSTKGIATRNTQTATLSNQKAPPGIFMNGSAWVTGSVNAAADVGFAFVPTSNGNGVAATEVHTTMNFMNYNPGYGWTTKATLSGAGSNWGAFVAGSGTFNTGLTVVTNITHLGGATNFKILSNTQTPSGGSPNSAPPYLAFRGLYLNGVSQLRQIKIVVDQVNGSDSHLKFVENFNGGADNNLFSIHNTGQLGVSLSATNPNTSAIIDAGSTTKGFLPPRMTGAQAEAISSPAEGLLVYATDGSGATITSKGWWGYEGSTWVKFN